MKRAIVAAAVIALASAGGSALAARSPTYLEKVTIMDAFNIPGRSFSSKCVRIVVSSVDPRWAYVTSPAHPPKACTQAGQVGDGLAVYKRSSRMSLHWRDVFEGEGRPCVLPANVRRDFFETTKCGGP
jgi:hypothetical protein